MSTMAQLFADISPISIVGDSTSKDQGSFGIGDSQRTLTLRVGNWITNVATGLIVEKILGYTAWQALSASYGRLNRTTPLSHPEHYWLYATRIANMTGRGPVGYENGADGNYPVYSQCDLEVVFSTLPFDVYEDGTFSLAGGIDDETKRYIVKQNKEVVEFLQRPARTFSWLVGGEPPGIAGAINAPISARVTKTYLEWTLHQVPHKAIYDTNFLLSSKIRSGLGKVNNAEWLGYPAGTLLALAPDIKPAIMPVAPTVLGLPRKNSPRSWDVTYKFVFFDPPYANASYRGHNIFPSPVDQLWYLASYDGTNATNQRLYPDYDFGQFFNFLP